MELTPYRIVRAPKHADAYEHNTPDATDERFTDDVVLNNYLTASRIALYEATLALIVEYRPIQTGDSLGDFGCGPGFFFDLMLDRYSGVPLYGYDQAPLTLQKAGQRLPLASFEVRDIYAAPDRRHEIVVCNQTLEHLPRPGLALQRLIEATKPGGICVLTVPDGRKDTSRSHINFWSPESWAEFLAERIDTQRHQLFTKYLNVGEAGGKSSLAAVIMVGMTS